MIQMARVLGREKVRESIRSAPRSQSLAAVQGPVPLSRLAVRSRDSASVEAPGEVRSSWPSSWFFVAVRLGRADRLMRLPIFVCPRQDLNLRVRPEPNCKLRVWVILGGSAQAR